MFHHPLSGEPTCEGHVFRQSAPSERCGGEWSFLSDTPFLYCEKRDSMEKTHMMQSAGAGGAQAGGEGSSVEKLQLLFLF